MKEFEEIMKSRKLSKKPSKNWTEDKYFRLWYLYDAVQNDIKYECFDLEINKISPNNMKGWYNTYQKVKDKTLSKEEFIEEVLDTKLKARSLYDFIKVDAAIEEDF